MIEIGNKTAAHIDIDGKVVEKITINNDVVYNIFDDYFYIENTYNGSNTITFTITSNNPTQGTYAESVQYSKNKETWSVLTFDDVTPQTVSLSSGEKLYLRNDSNCWGNSKWKINIKGSQNHNVGGNIQSLIDYTSPLFWIVLDDNVFNSLFKGDNKLVSASSLTLPFTELASSCYTSMFEDCVSLTRASSLPATTLASGCYTSMFYNCQELTTAPALPATTLAESCYRSMFYRCISLSSAPSLPATTLANNCYLSMFSSCSSLYTPPLLPSTTLASGCYSSMFQGCPFINAPELPATTLVTGCYKNMFKSCGNLKKVTIYADDISATNCLTDWLSGVAATGTFNNNGSATYTADSASGIPTGWTEVKPVDYFYVENTYAGQNTVTFTTTQVGTPTIGTYSESVEYSKNKTTWNTIIFDTSTPQTITLNQGEKVYFRNYNGLFNYTDSGARNYYVTTITCSESHNIGGNVTTILDYIDENVNIPTGCFYRLFINNNTLQAANITFNNNIGESCYREMFKGCTSLTTPPAILPATTLASSCYRAMFDSTISMTTTPELPASRVLSYSYAFMFQYGGITSATLKATIIENNGCQRIFRDCPINSLTVYANTISESNAINNWLSGVSQTGDFYNLGTVTYSSGVSGIPTGWTEYKCKLSNVVLTNTTGTQYSVTANMEWSSSLSWEQAEILILDQGGGQPANLDFGTSEVINGVLTPSTVMDFLDTPQPENYCEITLYDDQGNMVFSQSNTPYTIQ